MQSSLITKLRAGITLIVLGILSGCSSIEKQVESADPRPAYHLVTIAEDGVQSHYSHDGIAWDSFLHKGLSRTDCYDVAASPDGAQRFMVYSQTDKSGKRYLNVLRGSGTKRWGSKVSKLAIPASVSCAQPQMRHLRGNLYGIMWLDEGRLYSAIYDASESDGDNLYLSEPVQNDWFVRANFTDLSFAYHDDAVYVVWSPNSQDRIMTMRGEISGHTINYGEADYHIEDHISVSNMISDGQEMYIVVVAGKRVNMLKHSSDGSYWSKGPTCYNTSNLPIVIPFLYKDARGDKIYLKSYDYAGTVNYLQNFTDCERTEVKIPYDAIRIEYYPGLHD